MVYFTLDGELQFFPLLPRILGVVGSDHGPHPPEHHAIHHRRQRAVHDDRPGNGEHLGPGA